MKKMISRLLILFCLGQVLCAENYAVLVAGSNTFENYRHQADVSHAYHILVEKGFKKDNIITFMYDDLAYHKKNPFKGAIYNDLKHSRNYYENLTINYSKDEVTPENFLAVIQGEKSKVPAGRPVLQSTEEDYVFIYFSDHGGPDVICFPDNNLLEAYDFQNALQTMYTKKMYQRMLIYIEACESGSMFTYVPENVEVLAMTAADPTEPSEACFFDKSLNTYIGDTFSIHWMFDAEKHNLNNETIEQEYAYTKWKTRGSHVSLYGQRSMISLRLGEFLQPTQSSGEYFGKNHETPKDSINAMEVATDTLVRLYQKHVNDPLKRQEIIDQLYDNLKKRFDVKKSFERIYEGIKTDKTFDQMLKIDRKNFTQFNCLKTLRLEYNRNCYSIDEVHQAVLYHGIFYNLCSIENINLDELISLIKSVC